ncbi:MAG: GTPase Era [Hyphomicrobiaceae bacterium]|nr:GTPase Era [Hyphomicrobiaceae bacterium]
MAPEDTSPETAGTRCGFIALIGATNAGKSTLLNRLVGEKIAIVSHKVQTTRATVRGIALHGSSQIIFVDTPGLFRPKRRLDRAMVETAWGGAREADAVALLVDARKGLTDELREQLTPLSGIGKKKILVLNKIDLVRRDTLLALAGELNTMARFEATFMISALEGDGSEDLMRYLAAHVAPGPWLYPEDQVADAPLRVLAAEITREKIFERLHQELPYETHVETEQWTTRKDGSARVEQTIYVARDSQKKIVIGKGGQTLKWISTQARREITEAAGQPVHLFIFVKVREGWADDPARYREIGIAFPTD